MSSLPLRPIFFGGGGGMGELQLKNVGILIFIPMSSLGVHV